jgi:NADH-quinone oxidoreductase subunit J
MDVWMIILLALLLLSAVFAVMIRDLLKAAIALAATSVVLTVVMFLLGSPLAAVFELSVCAGLITAVFVSTITLTKPGTAAEMKVLRRERLKRFIALPVLMVLIGVGVWFAWPSIQLDIASIGAGQVLKVEQALWDLRSLDILGQIIIILAGVFGVVILFKGRKAK